MKRRALLFGNTNNLSGVKVDISNFIKFLKSDIGGQWLDAEIYSKMNPTRQELLTLIQQLKAERPDYAFVVFSGHGAFSKTTILELNSNGECVFESEVRNIATRQISIFDCCRNVIPTPVTESRAYVEAKNLSDTRRNIRPIYDARIMQSIEQQTSLYACSVNQSSYDTNEGGIFTNSFLSSTKPDFGKPFKLIGDAYSEAVPKTTLKAFEVYSKVQVPDHSIPKCLSSQQLIISINPNMF